MCEYEIDSLVERVSYYKASSDEWQRLYWAEVETVTLLRKLALKAALGGLDDAEDETWQQINGHE